MKREDALTICRDLLMNSGHLALHFEKYMVCGSIRRMKESVNDIDIVAIPKPDGKYQFGEPSLTDDIKRLDPVGAKLEKAYAARFLNGDKIKRFQYDGIMIDLYLATEKTFGTLVLIRTGSTEHNIRLTTLAMGQGRKLKASGKGLVDRYNEDMIFENTEDGILRNLLGRVPLPEQRD